MYEFTVSRTTLREILLVFLLAFLMTNAQDEGESCTKNDVVGTCTLLSNCQGAIKDIKNRRQPQICTFKGMDPVVCCFDSAPPPTTSKPPVLTTTTQRTKTTTEYVPPVYDYVLNDPNLSSLSGCEPIAASLTSPKTGQKAWDKCIEYQEKYVYPCVKGNSLSGEKGRNYRCKHDADELIIGGTNASQTEFPHMALLGFGSEVNSINWLCGGSVISERFILTAGHCTYSREAGPLTYALLGILSRSEHVDSSQLYKIKNIVKHPDYNPPKKYNDIALLETEAEIKLSETIVPACLHVDVSAPDQRVLATGWGLTENRGSTSDILMKVILNKFTESECASLFPPNRYMKNGFDSGTQMCYGDKNKSKDTCQGDSGGPLQLKNQKIHCMYTIVGVTSFGRACGFIGQPGMYTKVSTYVPWIERVVWP